MEINQDQYDELVMNLVVEGGNARSLAMEAIQEAKKGNLDRADELSALSLRNAPEAHILWADQLNTYDVLVNDDVVFTTAGLDAFLGKGEEESK